MYDFIYPGNRLLFILGAGFYLSWELPPHAGQVSSFGCSPSPTLQPWELAGGAGSPLLLLFGVLLKEQQKLSLLAAWVKLISPAHI